MGNIAADAAKSTARIEMKRAVEEKLGEMMGMEELKETANRVAKKAAEAAVGRLGVERMEDWAV